MSGVELSGPNNSTMFTTCCGVAICDDQRKCPRCGGFIYPDYESDDDLGIERTPHQRGMARWERAFGPYRQQARQGRWARS